MAPRRNSSAKRASRAQTFRPRLAARRQALAELGRRFLPRPFTRGPSCPKTRHSFWDLIVTHSWGRASRSRWAAAPAVSLERAAPLGRGAPLGRAVPAGRAARPPRGAPWAPGERPAPEGPPVMARVERSGPAAPAAAARPPAAAPPAAVARTAAAAPPATVVALLDRGVTPAEAAPAGRDEADPRPLREGPVVAPAGAAALARRVAREAAPPREAR